MRWSSSGLGVSRACPGFEPIQPVRGVWVAEIVGVTICGLRLREIRFLLEQLSEPEGSACITARRGAAKGIGGRSGGASTFEQLSKSEGARSVTAVVGLAEGNHCGAQDA